MAYYYLISQLPSLDAVADNMMPPIGEERFSELCGRFLNKKMLGELDKLTLMPPREHEKSASALIEAWNNGERDLRLCLAKARADRMKKPFDTQNRVFSPELIRAANTAAEFKSPLEAEKYLDQYRIRFLETLRPLDTFSNDFIYYYGLKLKLLLRIKQFNAETGEAAYKNIYSSVLDGDRLEVSQ